MPADGLCGGVPVGGLLVMLTVHVLGVEAGAAGFLAVPGRPSRFQFAVLQPQGYVFQKEKLKAREGKKLQLKIKMSYQMFSLQMGLVLIITECTAYTDRFHYNYLYSVSYTYIYRAGG